MGEVDRAVPPLDTDDDADLEAEGVDVPWLRDRLPGRDEETSGPTDADQDGQSAVPGEGDIEEADDATSAGDPKATGVPAVGLPSGVDTPSVADSQ